MTSENQTTNSGIRRTAKAALSVFVLVSISTAALKLSSHSGVSGSLGSRHFVLAAMLAVLYRAINPLGWVAVLRGMGYRVGAVAATNIWLAAESRRWLPGGIWGYASRAAQSKKLGVPVVVASASMLAELIITIAAAVLVSCIGLVLYFPYLKSAVADLITSNVIQWPTVLLAMIAMVMFVGVGYLLREKLVNKLNPLNEKWQLLQLVDISYRKLSLALAYFVAMACLNGVVNLVMLQACSDTSVPVIVMISATSAAWVIGYLAFFSPGGLFVREAVLAMLLLPWIPYPTALTVAVLSRLAQLFAEVLCMLLPMLSARSQASAQDDPSMCLTSAPPSIA